MSDTVYEQIGVERLTGAMGAVISGVDLAQELSAAQFAEIRSALFEFGAICFRDQKLDFAQLAVESVLITGGLIDGRDGVRGAVGQLLALRAQDVDREA